MEPIPLDPVDGLTITQAMLGGPRTPAADAG
jgi:hypothetical protein